MAVTEPYEQIKVKLAVASEPVIKMKVANEGSIDMEIPKGDKGDPGNGIASAVLNSDYTLTINYTDGTSFTTPIPIRGEQGEQGIKGDRGNPGVAMSVEGTTLSITPEAAEPMVVIPVDGTDPVIVAESTCQYVCGEVYSLNFTPSQHGLSDVVFKSGSTPTILTLPETVIMPEWYEGIESGYTYEINVSEGIYGTIVKWPIR